MYRLIIKFLSIENVPAMSERDVPDNVLVSSIVEELSKGVAPGVAAPLLRLPFFEARFVDELDRDRIRESFES